MDFQGLLMGVGTVLIIALSRWVCILGVYWCGKGFWVAFLGAGIYFISLSLFMPDGLLSALFSVCGFCCLWGIGETFGQVRRVAMGWYPDRIAEHNASVRAGVCGADCGVGEA